MVVKSQIKLIRSLQQKKYRKQHSAFVVEGRKTLQEFFDAKISATHIFSTDVSDFQHFYERAEKVSMAELKQMSSLKTPNKMLGVFKIPKEKKIDFTNWVVALDGVQDPGNLGTIIRLCDWFGIKDIICSTDTVDCYNPKVLQATMGSIIRVNVVYTNLVDVLKTAHVPIYGTFMDGNIVYNAELPRTGILVMGNEGNGISTQIEALCTDKISIPQFGKTTTESLNVATATAILLNEIRRS